MQVGSGDIAPRLLNLANWLKYVVTSHLATSTQGSNPPHLLKTVLIGPKNSEGRSGVRVNWNTIRRSANPHRPRIKRLPAIPAIPLVHAGPRGRPCGVCGGHINKQSSVALKN